MNKKKESKVVPNVRFKGFTDDWKQRKLGDEAEEILAGGDIDKEKAVDDGVYPIYANALTNDGIVGYYDDFYRVKAPAVTVTGRGEVGRARARMIDFTPVVRLLAVRSNHDCYFLENAINNHKVVVESTGVPQLTVPQLSSYDICFPKDIVEEKKIGTYFNQSDRLITFHQQKITLLTKLKKAMLEKMFPKKGTVIPEFRFNGFANAWEQRKLGEITKTHSFKQYISESFAQGKYAVIQQGENPIAGYADGNPFENYKDVTLFGDHTLSLFKPQGKFFVASDGIKILSPSLKMSGMFYYYLLEKYKPQSEGYKRHFTIMKKSTALFPIEIDEQVKISKFLKEFDFLITLHQRKLDMLKKLKSACLSEMFI